jgi:uncharacterized protein YfaS (alpha-2-macroglobulin family)
MLNRRRLLVSGAGVALAVGLLLGATGDSPTTRKTAELGGAERYLAHLSTDKPIYRAGETVYVRGVLLRADTHAPLPSGQANAMVEIRGPKGDVVTSGQAGAQDSVVGFSWAVPAGQAGGEYTVRMSFPWDGHAPAERKFDIRAYRAPRLKSQIVFVRDGYGPGDTVSASAHVERAEGGIPAGAKVTVTARVDGAEIHRGQAAIDEAGNVSASFKLPASIARGEGTLALAIEDGGVLETATKTIPILLQTVDLKFYPEGGELVRGIEQRVYFEARQPNGKPADIAGEIVDAQGKVIATFKTEHEGRGRVTLAQMAGKPPVARITQPAGIKATFTLPEIREKGASLVPAADVFAAGQPLRFGLTEFATTGGKLTISQREKVVGEVAFGPQNNPRRDLEVKLDEKVDGVLIATVWDEKGNPLAERLVYRQPVRQLRVAVTADQSSYTPGDKVTLRITTTDEQGKPVAGVVGVTVADDSVLEMIEKREQAPRLPVMVLLENDVRELADAHVYLDSSNPKAGLATDLLLGTQGWRRFALVDTIKFLAAQGDAGRRALAVKIVTQREKEMMRRFDMARFGALADGAEAMPMRAMKANGDGPPPPMARPAEAPDAVAAPKNIEEAVIANEKVVAGKPRVAAPVVVEAEMMLPAMVHVREYAHQVRQGRIEGDRVDFAETLYWSAGVKTDEKTGQATVSFGLSDAVTTFRAFADGFDKSGALGSATIGVESVQPFYIEPKLPLEVTSGDSVQMPIAMVNGMNRALPLATIAPQTAAGITVGKPPAGFTIQPRERARTMLKLDIGSIMGAPNLVIEGKAGPYADKVTRPLRIRPGGFPIEFARGGMLSQGKAATHEVTIPEEVSPGSVTTLAAVYPTPLGNLTQALERLIQEPSGCFEQTSSTSYPLVMAQQYFLNHTGVDPKLIERSGKHLDNAYKKLTGFECKQKGYEWFGGDPGHEALTAYGLMQFVDMTQVRKVDQEMIGRTRQWLLDKRDGKGGFKRNERALDSFGGAPPDTTDAYIVWALLESGEKGLEKEVAQAKQKALASNDSYVVAIGANVAALSGDMDAARKLMDKLSKSQSAEGAVEGALTSITRSSGDALKIETTALAVLGWLREPAFFPQIEKGIKWLCENCKSGRFGSTQSTILALRAIIHYDKSRARPKVAGEVALIVDGKSVGEAAKFTPQSEGAISLPECQALLTPGKHTIELRMTGGSEMPYSLTVNYYDALPASSDKCKVAVEVSLRDATVQEGSVTEIVATVANKDKDVVTMPVAIVGVPGGLEARHDQLKELVKAGTIDAYEVIGREVVLYWRLLKAGQKVQVPVSLVAAIPGSYTGPASRAYQYYADEFKQWVAGAKVTIQPK